VACGAARPHAAHVDHAKTRPSDDRPQSGSRLADKPGAWVDLALTLPVFLVYHLGVVFLDVRNASDVVTGALLSFAEGSKGLYVLFTAAIGVIFGGVFAWLGRGQAFQARKFVQIFLEGVLYAVLLRFGGSYVVAKVFAGKGIGGGFTGFVMSAGAGFYEEITYRVLLFGLGAKLIAWFVGRQQLRLVGGAAWRLSIKTALAVAGWSVVCAMIFSGVHYVGPLGDPFSLKTFFFRAVLGLLLTLIYATRGFAAAVWAHALYDVWVLVL
jgi:hypothetical protein